MLLVVRVVDSTAAPEFFPHIVNRAELQSNDKVQGSLLNSKLSFWIVFVKRTDNAYFTVVFVQVLELSQVFDKTVFRQQNVFDVNLAEIWQIAGQLEEVVM